MDTKTDVAPGGSDQIAVVTPASTDAVYSGASAAARELANLRWKRDNPEQAEAAPAEAAPAQESPQGDNAAPETEPGITPQEIEPAELPPIEPPRSWTKEEKEEFLTYPHDAQEKIARREQDRETALRRSQNEAAEKLKGLTAKEQAVEQARQQYEAALPALLETLNARHAGEFSDIKTVQDVQKLAAEDPFRFAQYQAKQMEIAAVQREAQIAQDRQAKEYQDKWSTFANEQDKLFADKFPLASDKAKIAPLMDEAAVGIKELGFSDGDLAKLWNGQSSISLRDARLQQIIAEWAQFRLAKKAAAKPAAKPVPPVQRPGAAQTRASAGDAQIQALQKRFDETGSPKDAAALLNARRAAQR